MFGDKLTSPLKGLSFKQGKDLKILVNVFNNSLFRFFKETLSDFTNEDKAKVNVLLNAIMDEPKPTAKTPNKFIAIVKKGGYEAVLNLSHLLLKAEGDYAVGPMDAANQNKKADELCSTLQETSIGDLTLTVLILK